MHHMNKNISPPTRKTPKQIREALEARAVESGLFPTTKPRVSVPVSAEVLVIFERLAKAGNMSTGRCIAEWLSDTVEAAELMASTMERARAAPKIVTAELHAMMLGMADQSKELMEKYSKMKAITQDGNGKRSAVRPGGALAPLKTPPSNTGVNYQPSHKTKGG
jgi:hypothetical protein